MRPFIVIRDYKLTDDQQCKDLIKTYVMSFAFDAFLSCLFREIFIQLSVIIAAFMFIILGLPFIICLCSVPIVIILIYVSVYSSFFSKAMEVACMRGMSGWVVELYEPYTLSLQMTPTTVFDYDIVPEERILSNDLEISRMRRTIVGTVSISSHNSLGNCGWISGLAIDPKRNFQKIAEPLVNRILKYGYDMQMYSIETVTTECQMDLRELLLKMGFNMKQIYHRQVLGSNSLRIMKSQMGIDLMTRTASKTK